MEQIKYGRKNLVEKLKSLSQEDLRRAWNYIVFKNVINPMTDTGKGYFHYEYLYIFPNEFEIINNHFITPSSILRFMQPGKYSLMDKYAIIRGEKLMSSRYVVDLVDFKVLTDNLFKKELMVESAPFIQKALNYLFNILLPYWNEYPYCYEADEKEQLKKMDMRDDDE